MRNRSRLQPRAMSGWRCRGGGIGVAGFEPAISSSRRRTGQSCCPSSGTVSCPLAPLGRACSGACDAPDELVCQCLLKLGILCVAAIFPAGERSDQCSPEDGVGGVAGVADRELAGGGALVEELSKRRGERRVLRGHEGPQSSGGSGEGEQAGAYSGLPPEEPCERGYRGAQLGDGWWLGGCDGELDCLGGGAQVLFQQERDQVVAAGEVVVERCTG